MITADDLRALVHARPFVAFRLYLSDGGTVDVRSPEVVMPGRRCALVGLLDPDARNTLFDRWTVVYYLHVTRVEMSDAGAPPFSAPAGSSETPSPAPA